MTSHKPKVLLDAVPELRLFFLGSVFLSLLAYFCADYGHEVLHLSYPYSTPFFASKEFTDLFTFRPRFFHYHHLDFFSLAKSRDTVFSYPPTIGALYALLYWPGKHIHAFYLCLSLPFVFYFVALLGQRMVRLGVAVSSAALFLAFALLTAYPFWLNFYLGNLEVLIAILLAFGVLSIVWGRLYLAAALIGLAGSMKLFPFFLLGILLARKKWGPLLFSLAVGAIAFVGATWMECPSFPVARAGMAAGAGSMNDGLVVRWMRLEDGMDHSLFALLKRAIHKHYEIHKGVFLLPHSYVTVYMGVAAVLGLLLYFLYIRKMPLLNQILSLELAAVMLPPLSHDYTLMHLYLPWGMFVLLAVQAAREGRRVPGLMPVFVCFTLLFTPQTEFIWKGSSVDGQFKAVVLVVLFYLSLKYPFPGVPFFQEASDEAAERKGTEATRPQPAAGLASLAAGSAS